MTGLSELSGPSWLWLLLVVRAATTAWRTVPGRRLVVGRAKPGVTRRVLASPMAKRRQAQAAERAVRAQLAETIDLFAVAFASGHNLVSATEQVARWAHGDLGQAIRRCLHQAERSRSLVDALEELPSQLGTDVRPLVAALAAHARFGAPIAPTLVRLADDSRTSQRRAAETAARRLPVMMLFPLVICVLPAFVLVTVVPVVAEAISGLDL